MLRKVKETAKYHNLQSRDYDDQRLNSRKINVRKQTFHDLYIKKHENVTYVIPMILIEKANEFFFVFAEFYMRIL